MGNCCDRCKRIQSSNNLRRNITLLVIGLDDAGKTTIAKGLIGDSVKYVLPTVGFSIFILYHRRYKVTLYDLGGNIQIRDIWNKYFADAHGIIFVIDASNLNRLDEARIVFKNTLTDMKISGKPVLLLANKQDKEDALDELDIVDHLNVEQVVNKQHCPTRVELCSALKSNILKLDSTIQNGYEWLINTIINNYGVINDRVNKDMMHQSLIVEKDKERWRKERARRDLEGILDENIEEHTAVGGENTFKPIKQVLEAANSKESKNKFMVNGTTGPIKHNASIEMRSVASITSNDIFNVPIIDSTENFKRKESAKKFNSHMKRKMKKKSNKIRPVNDLNAVNITSTEYSRKPDSGFKSMGHVVGDSKSIKKRPSTAPSRFNNRLAWDLSKPLETVDPICNEQSCNSGKIDSSQGGNSYSDADDVFDKHLFNRCLPDNYILPCQYCNRVNFELNSQSQ